ncbi:hypothetical protein PHLCEN_2v2163 [Hermanssonia centrifuga]|uniref:Uncharacterized protein n=1 Tax=Hermanssonia centrifuga TaxID=98765 RepID=A0A2R6RPV9_9APHY|nr:hypothetical protein PHLCEN_2v2163 [Hermanssonia centrifuga]
MRNLSQFSVPGFRVCTDLVSDMGGFLEHNPPLEVNISDPNSNEGRSEIIQNATGYDSVIEEVSKIHNMATSF